MNLEFYIQKPIDTVFSFLLDMKKFESAHPVITKIDHISDNKYLIHETLKFAFIPFSFTYPATVLGNPSQNQVVMEAVVMKLVNVRIEFNLLEENETTIIKEEIQFKSILPVHPILKGGFKKQHKRLFENIEAHKV